MNYPGSKARLAKHLLPYILEHRATERTPYTEPFCGGCNMLDKVPGNRYGYDINKYVIAHFQALQNGWEPPDVITESQYREIKTNPDDYDPALVAFVALCCSFGGKWFGGYARNTDNRNYAAVGRRHMLRQRDSIKGVRFACKDYRSIKIRKNSVVYCDPPYQGTTGYMGGSNFDHTEFFDWCRKISKKAYLYVSEYMAPDDFKCVVGVRHKTTIDIGQHDKRMERLFVYDDGLAGQ